MRKKVALTPLQCYQLWELKIEGIGLIDAARRLGLSFGIAGRAFRRIAQCEIVEALRSEGLEVEAIMQKLRRAKSSVYRLLAHRRDLLRDPAVQLHLKERQKRNRDLKELAVKYLPDPNTRLGPFMLDYMKELMDIRGSEPGKNFERIFAALHCLTNMFYQAYLELRADKTTPEKCKSCAYRVLRNTSVPEERNRCRSCKDFSLYVEKLDYEEEPVFLGHNRGAENAGEGKAEDTEAGNA